MTLLTGAHSRRDAAGKHGLVQEQVGARETSVAARTLGLTVTHKCEISPQLWDDVEH